MLRALVRGLAASLILAAPVLAQGRSDYFNVESPPVHPIEVFRLGNHDFFAAANTRDGSVEIWDTRENVANRRLARVRVGLEPVSVRFDPVLSRLYTANFLGDSISVIRVSAPTGPTSFTATFEKTAWVGDEPMDLAFFQNGDQRTLFVSHMALDGFDWRDALTLAVVSGKAMVAAQVPFSIGGQTIQLALKEPRTVSVRSNRLFLLATKGGNNAFDFDIYCDDLSQPFVNPGRIAGLGSTGLNMAFDAAGTLYVVGGEAQNMGLADEPNVMAAPTGFVKSTFYRIANPCQAGQSILARDVNEELVPVSAGLRSARLSVKATAAAATAPVPFSSSLSMLTDLAVFETGGVPKVFFTAMGNDRVGVIRPDPAATDPLQWAISRINLKPLNGNPLAGPRGIAVKPANPAQSGDPGARVYVLNHLDGSITTIDPLTETVVPGGNLSLKVDPRPAYLKTGQRFLYDAKLSGNGKVSCASCHVDARTDRLPWDLGTPALGPVVIPSFLPDGIPDTLFPADKGKLITQSLQGLLNYEVVPGELFWTTNAPYHWRGDRADFTAFNGAFASLLGGTMLEPEQMLQFQEFINTVSYPPNPQQPRNRVPSGLWSDGSGGVFPNDGSTLALRGMKFYHDRQTVGERSCAGCHELPEGSNNRLTDPGVVGGQVVGQPIETAALRGLLQLEAKRDVDGFSNPLNSPATGLEGLFHDGFIGGATVQEFNLTASINAFNKTAFSANLCGTPGQISWCNDLASLNQFVHEVDWGAGPLIGCPATVNLANAAQALPGAGGTGCSAACTDLASSLSCMEEQAGKANSGLAVQARLATADRGFWFDPTSSLYREEPAGVALTRAALVGLIATTRDWLVFQAVPLGSERRLAAPSGVASDLPPAAAPSSLHLMPMVADSFYQRVPELSGAWATLNNLNAASPFVHTARLYQWGLIQDAASQNGFGFGTALRHDAPRRFQVSGQGLRHGAWLHLAYLNTNTQGPPNPQGPLDQGPVGLLSFPLYPTGSLDPENHQPVWQTAVEVEPTKYYGLLLGGPWGPNVATAYLDTTFTFPMVDPVLDKPPVGSFDPLGWNWYYVIVTNADGAIGFGGWQRLRIQ